MVGYMQLCVSFWNELPLFSLWELGQDFYKAKTCNGSEVFLLT